MKKIFFILLMCPLFTLIAQESEPLSAATNSNNPVFDFEEEVIDYGKVLQNSDGNRVFKFKNTGKSPLIISNIKSSCGCTIPEKPTAPIMPEKTGEIKVHYNTRTLGGFSKSITIYSNASEPTKRVRIKGIVQKPDPEKDKVGN